MLSGDGLADKVRWYRTMATNSQLGDLIRHEYELIEQASRARAEAAALRERLATLQDVADRLNYGETGWPRVLQLQDELARRDARLATVTPIVKRCLIVPLPSDVPIEARAWLAQGGPHAE